MSDYQIERIAELALWIASADWRNTSASRIVFRSNDVVWC